MQRQRDKHFKKPTKSVILITGMDRVLQHGPEYIDVCVGGGGGMAETSEAGKPDS